MRIYVLSALLVVSFIASVATAFLMNWLTVASVSVFAATILYINRHEKELQSDFDDAYGRDDKFN